MKLTGRRAGVSTALAMVLSTAVVMSQSATAGVYVGGATVVYKEAGDPEGAQADRGVAICSVATEAGVGGACLPFPGFPAQQGAVQVGDFLAGPNVAFQVCIDNNGDGKCLSGGDTGPFIDFCPDEIYFSHNDKGEFFNPLGPLPTSRGLGCLNPPLNGWNGYVVFLCDGVHAVRNELPHSHQATSGTVALAPMGFGFGDFCGGTRDLVVEKDYILL